MPKKLSTEIFIEKARKIHKNKYDYSKVIYKDAYSDVIIICPIHGEFKQKPYSHLSGHGCIRCAKKKKHTKQSFIIEAKKVHGNKYDYSKVDYKNNKTKVCIICPIHGEFWQRPDKHLQGRGCCKCGGTCKSSKKEFIEESNIVHKNRYDYSKVIYKNTETKVCIICPIHGEFWQTPHAHLQGQGCPFCKQSILENYIHNLLTNNNITFEREKTFEWLVYNGHMFLDFYLPEHNIAIECQGIQHFKPVNYFGGIKSFLDTQKRDFLKYKLCDDNGIKIIYYSDIKEEYFQNVYCNKEEIINKIYEHNR